MMPLVPWRVRSTPCWCDMKIGDVYKMFGVPFVVFVKSMRGLGYTYKTIASVIGVSYNTFRKWQKGYGLSDGRYNLEVPTPSLTQEAAKNKGYKDLTDAMRQYRMDGKTREELAKDLGLTYNQARNAMNKAAPTELKGEQLYTTEKQRRARRKNANKINRLGLNKRKDHPWRKEQSQ